MRAANLRILVLTLAFAGVAACANNDSGWEDARSDARADGPTDARVDAPMDARADVHDAALDVARPDVRDVSTDVPRDTGGRCPSSCTSDLQCQSSCPASPGGTNCCDRLSGICYVSTGICPASTPDSGTMGMY
jgi:hypothetical protein